MWREERKRGVQKADENHYVVRGEIKWCSSRKSNHIISRHPEKGSAHNS